MGWILAASKTSSILNMNVVVRIVSLKINSIKEEIQKRPFIYRKEKKDYRKKKQSVA